MESKKKGWKIILVIITVLPFLAVAAWSVWHFSMDPYRENLEEPAESAALDVTFTRKDAEEDLAYLVKQLKTYHPAWLSDSSTIPEEVAACQELELAALGESVSTKELWQAAARITAAARCGHVRVLFNSMEPLYISDITMLKDHRLLAVNGIPAKRLYQTFLEQFSYELESYAREKFGQYLLTQANLEFLNVDTTDGVDFTFETETGEETVHYGFVPKQETAGADETSDGQDSFVSFTLEPEHDAAVLVLTECSDNQEYRHTLEDFFQQVEKNGIHNVIVDLRDNGGGNSYVANRFISYLDVEQYFATGGVDIRLGGYLRHNQSVPVKNQTVENPFSGDVFVLTSSRTFSSAMLFAEMIGDNGLGQLVGEVSGNMPESYGDILTFQMPHSGLVIVVPYKMFKRIDQAKKDLPLIPDVETDSAEALEKVYELIDLKKTVN